MFNHSTNNALWEKRLRIQTGAAHYEKQDGHHSPYEPTSYAVLERLAGSGEIGRNDVLIDYGCGKGRVPLYLHYATGCNVLGVEYDQALHAVAEENLASYTGRNSGGKISFVLAPAESHAVGSANRFYFFNPFSARILQGVLSRIREAWYDDPREMKLFFYYTQDSYLDLLARQDDLDFAGEIDCRDLFHNDDPREKILIYRMNPAM